MKVFLTIEKEKGDDRKEVEMVLAKCVDFIDVLDTNKIPNQFKITSLPRKNYRRFKPLLDMQNIES